jgi:hypothetical protein
LQIISQKKTLKMKNELTWNEMFSYLSKQDNCMIHHKEFKVLNLHDTLNRYQKTIEFFKPKERATNLNCLCLKEILKKMYHLHKQNKFTVIKS